METLFKRIVPEANFVYATLENAQQLATNEFCGLLGVKYTPLFRTILEYTKKGGVYQHYLCKGFAIISRVPNNFSFKYSKNKQKLDI